MPIVLFFILLLFFKVFKGKKSGLLKPKLGGSIWEDGEDGTQMTRIGADFFGFACVVKKGLSTALEMTAWRVGTRPSTALRVMTRMPSNADWDGFFYLCVWGGKLLKGLSTALEMTFVPFVPFVITYL